MSAKFIIRFDDFCPGMNWLVWEKIESILAKHNIKPIIAVVPDNRDPKLDVGPLKEDFWGRVRGWQSAGWTIAIHGYQHVYSVPNSGLMGKNKYSEFAGLSYEEQRTKLEKGLAIFKEQSVRADAWIAPAHAFDKNTVKALLDLNINVISDGYYLKPVKRLGALWIPQQIWRFRNMRRGLWTVCLHHNSFTEEEIKSLERDIDKYALSIISIEQAIKEFPAREVSLFDHAMDIYWKLLLEIKPILWPVVEVLKRSVKK